MTSKQKINKIKLPQSALAFYIKLYCERKGSTETKYHSNLIEATKSWLSLSEDEKQQFHSKFKECEEKYKLHFFNQLKNAEPFMKARSPSIRHDDSSIINVENSDHGALPGDHPDSQPRDYSDNQPADLAPDTESEPIETFEQSTGSEAADIPTLESHDFQTEQNENEVETADRNIETPSILIEPLPPTIKTGHQLYYMLNCTDENNTNTWATLPQFEKNRYSRAVAIMKKDYISKYKEYLLSLTPKQLFDYYNKNI